jgi:hypothetical protein
MYHAPEKTQLARSPAMSQSYDLLDTFAEHETMVFTVTAKDRTGAAITGATYTFVVTSDAARNVPVFEATSSPQIVDLGAGVFQIKPTSGNLALMTPGTIYYYDVWSIDGTNGRLHQVDGKIRLQPAAKEA